MTWWPARSWCSISIRELPRTRVLLVDEGGPGAAVVDILRARGVSPGPPLVDPWADAAAPRAGGLGGPEAATGGSVCS